MTDVLAAKEDRVDTADHLQEADQQVVVRLAQEGQPRARGPTAIRIEEAQPVHVKAVHAKAVHVKAVHAKVVHALDRDQAESVRPEVVVKASVVMLQPLAAIAVDAPDDLTVAEVVVQAAGRASDPAENARVVSHSVVSKVAKVAVKAVPNSRKAIEP